jgi:hypothetical protein
MNLRQRDPVNLVLFEQPIFPGFQKNAVTWDTTIAVIFKYKNYFCSKLNKKIKSKDNPKNKQFFI